MWLGVHRFGAAWEGWLKKWTEKLHQRMTPVSQASSRSLSSCCHITVRNAQYTPRSSSGNRALQALWERL